MSWVRGVSVSVIDVGGMVSATGCALGLLHLGCLTASPIFERRKQLMEKREDQRRHCKAITLRHAWPTHNRSQNYRIRALRYLLWLAGFVIENIELQK